MDKISNLTPEQQKLFKKLLEQEGIESKAHFIPRRKSSEILPSFAQQRLWFLQEFETEKSLYNCPLIMTVRGPLKTSLLEKAIEQIVARHESLRTTFEMKEGQPRLQINPAGPIDLPLVDLIGAEVCESKRNQLVEQEIRRPFDLRHSPLLRILLLRMAADEHVLIVTMHHIVSDAWSLGIFGRELAVLYDALSKGEEPSLPELPIQYADYSAWQREWLETGILEKQLGYWREQMRDLPELLELSIAKARPPVQKHTGRRLHFYLQKSLLARVKQLSQKEDVTLFMWSLAAFQILLWRYSGQTDVAVGTPVAGRHWKGTEPLIGFFVNTLVLRTDLSGNLTFADLLQKVRDVALGAFSNQDLPFEKLTEDLQPERDMSRNPLFQVMLVFQNAGITKWQSQELELEQEEVVETGTSKFDLTLQLQEKDEQMQGLIAYRDDLFEESAIQGMAAHFEVLLKGIVQRPESHIGELEILTEEEKRHIEKWNDTASLPSSCGLLHGLFEKQAHQIPAAVAVRYEGSTWTYAELNQQANQLANFLRSMGAGPEKLVGICTRRTPQMIVAMLAILKSGAAYVPLDPTYPQERLRYMLADCCAGLVLTESMWSNNLPQDLPARVIFLDTEQRTISGYTADSPPALFHERMAAYVIYTSGSTAQPKGAVIEHYSAAELVAWAGQIYGKDELAGVLFSTSICFDLSIFELFVPLSFGGAVILADSAMHLPQAHLSEITLINTVPSAITELLRLKTIPAGTKTINLAGEVLSRETVEQIYEQSGVQRVVNLYGPTEDTTYSTYAELKRGDHGEVPIGRPISNAQAHILDENLQPVPSGVAGELHLGGAGLARGYLYRPEMTAAKFRPNPFAAEPGKRLYQTGDRARWSSNGVLLFLGRFDNQVKVRGYRIELGEIEVVLREHEAVMEAAVILQETNPGEKKLVGCLVFHKDKDPLKAEALKRYLGMKLPEYMIPDIFVVLDKLPLTSNGKLDRKQLQKSGGERLAVEQAYVAPKNSVEELLAEMWAELLQCARIGTKDNFFARGGHSLQAMQVASKMREILQIEVPVRLIFNYPTVEALSKALQDFEISRGQLEKMARLFLSIQQMSIEEVDSRLKTAKSARLG